MNSWSKLIQRIDVKQPEEPAAQHLQITYELDGIGTAKCIVESNSSIAQVFASYSSHALRDLILSAISVSSGFHGVEFSFQEEPGQYRWALEATGVTTVDLSLFEFADTCSAEARVKGSELLLVHTNRRIYAEAVCSAALAVLARHGPAGYRTLWHANSFPANELTLLEASIENIAGSA